jgi:hypothetical protein
MSEDRMYKVIQLLDTGRNLIKTTVDRFETVHVKRKGLQLSPIDIARFEKLEKEIIAKTLALSMCINSLEKAFERKDGAMQERLLDTLDYGVNETENHLAAYLIFMDQCEDESKLQ